MTSILWSEVVNRFGAGYDQVFDNMGRKAYFDFNRDLSTSNFIDVSSLCTTYDLNDFRIFIGCKEGLETAFHDGCYRLCLIWNPAQHLSAKISKVQST